MTHSKTLCKLVGKDFHLKEKDKYLDLICDHRYYCEGCGRVAAKKKHLCKAVKI